MRDTWTWTWAWTYNGAIVSMYIFLSYNYLPCKKENNVARQEEEEEFLEPLTIIYKNVIVFTFSFCGFLVSLLNRYICI